MGWSLKLVFAVSNPIPVDSSWIALFWFHGIVFCFKCSLNLLLRQWEFPNGISSFSTLYYNLSLINCVVGFQKFTVPQRFFCHFYVVAVVWTTLLLFTLWAYAYKMAPSVSEPSLYSTIASHLTGGSHMFSFHKSHLTLLQHRHRVWSSVFVLLLMEIHVVRRLIETIYTFQYSPSARMHIFGYLTGLLWVVLLPLYGISISYWANCSYCKLQDLFLNLGFLFSGAPSLWTIIYAIFRFGFALCLNVLEDVVFIMVMFLRLVSTRQLHCRSAALWHQRCLDLQQLWWLSSLLKERGRCQRLNLSCGNLLILSWNLDGFNGLVLLYFYGVGCISVVVMQFL